MLQETLVRRVRLPVSAEYAFDWHCRPGAFERLVPPWQRVKVLERDPEIRNGARATLGVSLGPFVKCWVAEHQGIVAGQQFEDRQISGPFAFWHHTHSFLPDGPLACVLEDRIEYALPWGGLGATLGAGYVRRELERLFDYRHAVTAHDLAWHWAHRKGSRMRVLVSGSTGLVGTALAPLLTAGGHEVVRLVRSKARNPSKELVTWDPEANYVDAAGLEGLDAVVHLAGESIASGRWNEAKKARIRESRVRGTRILCEALSHLTKPPATFLGASAIGYYGNRGDERLTESSPAGTGFLAEVCRDWEAATEPARQKGLRVINLRIGVVLSPAGGALAKMLTPFKLGLGGVIGSGKQYMSCISLDDLVSAIAHCLTTPALSGPVNGVMPQAVTNHEFTKTLGKVLNRPTIFPMPAFAAKLALGQMAEELLLSSQRVEPARLVESGFQFRTPDLESALRHVLGRPGERGA